MEEKEQWYTAKDLFEMVQELQKGVKDLSTQLQLTSLEMKQTRDIVAKYNGLREEIKTCGDRIDTLENQSIGARNVMKAIREWGGWIVAILALINALIRK